MNIQPYLMFNGNCEEALNFYAQVFNGKIEGLMRFKGTPAESMSPDPDKVMHATFVAGDMVFMASDGAQDKAPGNVHLSTNWSDVPAMEKTFGQLAAGGNVTMPLADTFWGARFGMLTDKYGINWMFSSEHK
jgi:PhnB protein